MLNTTAETEKDTLMPCRESFEMWLTANGDYPHLAHKHFGGGYLHDEAAMKWDAWKGAWNTRAQPVAVDAGGGLAEVVELLKRKENNCAADDSYTHGWNDALDAIVDNNSFNNDLSAECIHGIHPDQCHSCALRQPAVVAAMSSAEDE